MRKARKKRKARTKKKVETTCKRCGKPYVWMRTVNDKWIPVEPASYDGAKLYVQGHHEPHMAHCGRKTKEEKAVDTSSAARHFGDCGVGEYVDVNGSLFLRLPPWPVTIRRSP